MGWDEQKRRKGKYMVDFTNDGPEVPACTMDAEDAVERFGGGAVMSKKCLCWQ